MRFRHDKCKVFCGSGWQTRMNAVLKVYCRAVTQQYANQVCTANYSG